LDHHRHTIEVLKKAGTIVAEFARVGHAKIYGTKRNRHKVIGKNGHSLGTVVARSYTSVLDRVCFWNEPRSRSMVKRHLGSL